MTEEEYKLLENGDQVMLVDNIRDIAANTRDANVLEDTFIPGDIYEVLMEEPSDGWVGIDKNAKGNSNHGWPRERWQLINKHLSNDLYKILGMEAN